MELHTATFIYSGSWLFLLYFFSTLFICAGVGTDQRRCIGGNLGYVPFFLIMCARSEMHGRRAMQTDVYYYGTRMENSTNIILKT